MLVIIRTITGSKFRLDQPAWIILIKAGTVLNTSTTTVQNLYQNVSNRMEVAVYAQDYSPIQQRYIAQRADPPGYRGRVAGAQSDLYNTFDPKRFDQGNELVYELLPGRYLICVSATSNEEFRYALGLMVIQFPQNDENFILLEDTPLSYLLQEDEVNVPGEAPFIEIASPITFDITLDTTSAYTVGNAEIVSGIFVQVNNENPATSQSLTWQIGPDISGTIPDQLNNRVSVGCNNELGRIPATRPIVIGMGNSMASVIIQWMMHSLQLSLHLLPRHHDS